MEIHTTIKYLKDANGGSVLYLHLIPRVPPAEASWTLGNDCRLLQIVALVIAALTNLVSSLEQITNASGTWHAVIELATLFFVTAKRNRFRLCVYSCVTDSDVHLQFVLRAVLTLLTSVKTWSEEPRATCTSHLPCWPLTLGSVLFGQE